MRATTAGFVMCSIALAGCTTFDGLHDVVPCNGYSHEKSSRYKVTQRLYEASTSSFGTLGVYGFPSPSRAIQEDYGSIRGVVGMADVKTRHGAGWIIIGGASASRVGETVARGGENVATSPVA